MTFKAKVEYFKECINESISANQASLLAHSRYGLNAASCEDQAAWEQANDELGWPFASW